MASDPDGIKLSSDNGKKEEGTIVRLDPTPPSRNYDTATSSTPTRGPDFKDQVRNADVGTKPGAYAARSDNKPENNSSEEQQLQLPDYKDQMRNHVLDRQTNKDVPKKAADDTGPADKDQARNATPLEKVAGARASRNAVDPQNPLPTFKDQAQDYEPQPAPAPVKVAGTRAPQNAVDPQNPLPTFKDQAQDYEPQPAPAPVIQPHREDVDMRLDNDSNGAPLINAHVVNDKSVVTAEALTGGVFCQRRVIVALVLVLVAAAAAVGGVCGGTDLCQRAPAKGTPTPTVAPITMAPTTPVPSQSPSVAPTIGPRATATLNYLNSISFSTIVYPPPPTNATGQDHAIQWLLEDDPLQLDVNDPDQRPQLTQRYALAALYFATGGSSWTRGWLSEGAASECTWWGVTCLADNRVESIGASEALRGNNLRGSLPPDIALLESLTFLDLSSNPELRGSLPASIGNIRGLNTLVLASCGLAGTLPTSLGSLDQLIRLDLSSNSLTGPFPTMSSARLLVIFQVAFNELSGPLPVSEEWELLQLYDARENSFSGSLSGDALGSWSNLEVRFLSRLYLCFEY